MVWRFKLAAIVSLALVACNPVENLDRGEKQIEKFEKVYSAGQVDQLYSLTGEDFQEVTTDEDFADLHKVVSVRLGKIVSSERTGFNSNFNNGLNYTVVVMETEFEKGKGTQTYTFSGNGDDMSLVGWRVDSPRLALTVDDLQTDEAAE